MSTIALKIVHRKLDQLRGKRFLRVERDDTRFSVFQKREVAVTDEDIATVQKVIERIWTDLNIQPEDISARFSPQGLAVRAHYNHYGHFSVQLLADHSTLQVVRAMHQHNFVVARWERTLAKIVKYVIKLKKQWHGVK